MLSRWPKPVPIQNTFSFAAVAFPASKIHTSISTTLTIRRICSNLRCKMIPSILNWTILTLFVVAAQITPSHQKRKPDPAEMMLEISEAGEVKQIPLIQPALDAISGIWSSFSGAESKPVATSTTKAPLVQASRLSTPKPGVRPVKAGAGMVKPAVMNLKPTEAVKPMAYHPVAAKPTKTGKLKATTAKVITTEKTVLQTSVTPEKVTVTPKELSVAIVSTLPTEIKRSSESTATTEPTTTSIRPSRANSELTQMTPVPIEYVLRLEELLMQLQEYNNELTNMRTEINV